MKMNTGLRFVLVLFLLLCGCSPKQDSPAEVKERAADATAEIKRDTKAVAQGIREGWTRDNSIDLNTASKDQLETLSGVTPKIAASIISHRPYANKSELVDRRILAKTEYDKIADRLTVK